MPTTREEQIVVIDYPYTRVRSGFAVYDHDDEGEVMDNSDSRHEWVAEALRQKILANWDDYQAARDAEFNAPRNGGKGRWDRFELIDTWREEIEQGAKA